MEEGRERGRKNILRQDAFFFFLFPTFLFDEERVIQGTFSEYFCGVVPAVGGHAEAEKGLDLSSRGGGRRLRMAAGIWLDNHRAVIAAAAGVWGGAPRCQGGTAAAGRGGGEAELPRYHFDLEKENDEMSFYFF